MSGEAAFVFALIGVAACIRAEAPPEQVRAACRVATSVVGPRARSAEQASGRRGRSSAP